MKNIILMALLCTGFFSAQAQNEFTIQGKVKGLKDGTVVTLFRAEGFPPMGLDLWAAPGVKIMTIWGGYGEGSLKAEMKELLGE